MTVLFCGGEIEDFSSGGSVSSSTTTSFYRTAYARMVLMVNAGAFNTNYYKASFTASSAFSVTARTYYQGAGTAGSVLLWLATGGSARLRLKIVSGTFPTTIALESYTSGGSATTLATSTSTIPSTTQLRFDVIVDYQVAGRVRVYVDQVLYIDYSGDVTASGATTLDGLYLGQHAASVQSCYWSEVIVATQDTRTMSLKTMVPDAAGSANAWTGAYTDVDDVVASETDVMTSGTANQVANLNTTGMPTGWSNLTVAAIKVIASAARGSTGPSKLAVGCRTNSTDSFPTSVTLDTGYTTPVATYYQSNPVTGVAWTTTEVDAFQIALKSET